MLKLMYSTYRLFFLGKHIENCPLLIQFFIFSFFHCTSRKIDHWKLFTGHCEQPGQFTIVAPLKSAGAKRLRVQVLHCAPAALNDRSMCASLKIAFLLITFVLQIVDLLAISSYEVVERVLLT
jgi:hypothetical protein